MSTRKLIAIVAVLVLAFKFIAPHFTLADLIPTLVIVPCLTAALYGAFTRLGIK